ncbi:hypothetical protein HPB49_021520 [Dermacentor silvarum]|uniref:Uncharacterized protein n=1 Tax=Dermacentor silvarum TaxID=543639 RepID=A0ACB8DR24_DERSI|nr:hypothetical protein HPB49_021520 [Dermacentor silvarum]
MVLWFIAACTILGVAFLGVYHQKWQLYPLGLGQRRWDNDFYGAPPLLVHKRDPPRPVFDHVRAATERIDKQRYESVKQALQVARITRDSIPVESLIILLPLLLGIIFKICCRRKQRRPSSKASFSSEASWRSSVTLHDLLGDGPLRSPEQASHNGFTDQDLTDAGKVQQWLPAITGETLQGHRPNRSECIATRLSDADERGFRAGQEGLRSRDRSQTFSASNKAACQRRDGSEVRGNLAEDLYYQVKWRSQDNTEKIPEIVDYGNEDQPLLQVSDDSSDSESNGGRRCSGGGDGDRSDVNNSGLSEETAYMELPNSERSSEAASICSWNAATQKDWLSVTAAVDPLVVTRTPLPSPQRRPRNLFDQLLEACRQPEPVSFSATLQELRVDTCVKLHESEYADIFLVSTVRGDTMTLKVYDCARITKYMQCLINEVRIGWSLTMLAEGLENQTRGFPQLHMTRCVWDSYPGLLESACASYLTRKGSADFRKYGRKLYAPYAVICMENAGEPLSKITLGQFNNALELRSVVQQVALALAVAEAELEFEHRALTPGHVLVRPARRRVAHYRFMNTILFVELHGWEACIVDFAASRLYSGGGEMPVYVGLHELPDEKRNAVGDSLALIDRIVRPDASRFQPYTNVILLHDLVHGLLRTHEQIFAYGMSSWTNAEREAWRDLTLWSEEIPACSSARAFVIARFVPSNVLAEPPQIAEGTESHPSRRLGEG